MKSKRLGLLGGTFNPVHNGHLAMAQTAFEQLKLNKVIFIPSYSPVHKSSKRIIPSDQRYRMVELAVKPYKHFEISNIELKRKGKSYSIDTVRRFKDELSARDKMFFILGTDNSSQLHTWKKINELYKLVTFVCINRPGCPPKRRSQKCTYLEMPDLDISSSEIRKRISKNKPVGFLMPEAVSKFIIKNKLYQ